MATLRVFPHCDMHLALGNPAAKTIDLRIFRLSGAHGPFTLNDITSTCTAQVLAPHNAVGSRLQSFVNIDLAAKTITATQLGTNLVIFQSADAYVVARVQVHQNIEAWWFGNERITTAVDTQHAHSQPSIYAMFSDDATGTDRVGDVTGHGFVTLSSSLEAVFKVANANKEGRLQGVGEGGATLNGAFLGINSSIPVKVVDYAKTRDILDPVRAGDLANAADRHNILFLAEGFTAADEQRFNEIVTKAADELLSKPRHEPFATLAPSFNVFKAFTESNDRLVTCGFKAGDTQIGALPKGAPIPYDSEISAGKYNVAELAARVGLPMRGEARSEAQLKTLWGSQSLHDFDATRVDGALVDAWKASQALGMLEARDTFFGMMLGDRYADKASRSGAALPTPAADDASDPLKAFVRRAYEFYALLPSRALGMDSRRHPPELFLRGNESRTSALMTFIGNLRVKDPPNQTLGTGWVPDGTFKPSRGLVAMIVNDHLIGGTNLNDNTLTANCVMEDVALTANYVADANPNIKRLRRAEPAAMKPNITSINNTIAHEFGHSFKLGDEYEESPEYPRFRNDFLDPNDTTTNFFDTYDNVASLEAIAADASYLTSGSRKIDPSKLKWAVLPRIKLSARTTAAAQVNNDKLELQIDRREVNAWETARTAGDEVHLRRIVIAPDGRQLPLSATDTDHLTGLRVESVDAVSGKIVLSSTAPLAPAPNFPVGSSLFVPHRAQGGGVQTIMEDKVLAELSTSQDPLNKDSSTVVVNRGADFPRDIADFKPPCQSARLIGVFEGAAMWAGLVYRPAGTCKMRTSRGSEQDGEFCHVCKWLITQRVDPGKHHEVERKFYPKAKKNE